LAASPALLFDTASRWRVTDSDWTRWRLVRSPPVRSQPRAPCAQLIAWLPTPEPAWPTPTVCNSQLQADRRS